MAGARAGMADLIANVRGIIGDPAGDAATFRDEEVQRALDRYRVNLDLEPLEARRTVPNQTSYTVHRARLGSWEATPLAYLGDGTALELAADTDLEVGEFITAEAQVGTVVVTGRSYDVHAAAAELLEEWAARVARRNDFTADGATHRRSQQREGLLEAAAAQRALARAVVVSTTRSDLRP